jgi:CubicO group peptidase (beta-lactamase class C family)
MDLPRPHVPRAPVSPGLAPAGSLYSTTGDLAKFLSLLFAGGRGVLRPTRSNACGAAIRQGGLRASFALSEPEGKRRIGHGGAIYGFATDLGPAG